MVGGGKPSYTSAGPVWRRATRRAPNQHVTELTAFNKIRFNVFDASRQTRTTRPYK